VRASGTARSRAPPVGLCRSGRAVPPASSGRAAVSRPMGTPAWPRPSADQPGPATGARRLGEAPTRPGVGSGHRLAGFPGAARVRLAPPGTEKGGAGLRPAHRPRWRRRAPPRGAAARDPGALACAGTRALALVSTTCGVHGCRGLPLARTWRSRAPAAGAALLVPRPVGGDSRLARSQRPVRGLLCQRRRRRPRRKQGVGPPHGRAPTPSKHVRTWNRRSTACGPGKRKKSTKPLLGVVCLLTKGVLIRVSCPAATRVQAHGLGTCMDCRRSISACWLTFRTPSCGRSRSAMSPMTTEKVKATASSASDRLVRERPAR
jgi:hypothetical protein